MFIIYRNVLQIEFKFCYLHFMYILFAVMVIAVGLCTRRVPELIPLLFSVQELNVTGKAQDRKEGNFDGLPTIGSSLRIFMCVSGTHLNPVICSVPGTCFVVMSLGSHCSSPACRFDIADSRSRLDLTCFEGMWIYGHSLTSSSAGLDLESESSSVWLEHSDGQILNKHVHKIYVERRSNWICRRRRTMRNSD